jgi:hypothetical protein
MSDVPEGAGWWKASDGRWYPPEQWTGTEESRPHAPEPVPSSVPPPYNGPPTASVPTVAPTAPWHSAATPPSTASVASTSSVNGAVPWYYTWWAIVPLLVCCWPVGLVLLWMSPQTRNAKVAATAVTAVLFGLLLVGGALSNPSEDALDASANDRTATTVKKTTTTAGPTTTAKPAATTTTTTPTTTTTTTTTAPPPPPPTTAPPPTAPPISPSQSNARRSAESYLDFAAFSRSGLIDQLAYEGFSRADAEWAVDNLNPDWNQQAAKSAASYLEFSAFSRSGLIDQLLYEGFTQSQAEYGVSTTGL